MYNTPSGFRDGLSRLHDLHAEEGDHTFEAAPNTADPNPQPGACWSVSILPDGTQVGGFASPGPSPTGIEWDGTYLWCADNTADYIYQLKVDGSQVGGFASPGPDPQGLAWDGAYLWHVNRGNYIYQLKTDGTQTGNGFVPPGTDCFGCAWDGTYIWDADATADYVYQLKTDGTQLEVGLLLPVHPLT